jgi:hypothetical protein
MAVAVFVKYIFLLLARTTLFGKYIFLRPAKTVVGRTFPVLCGTFHKNTFFFVLQKQPLGALFPYSVALSLKYIFLLLAKQTSQSRLCLIYIFILLG